MDDQYVPRREYEDLKKMVMGNGQPGMIQTLARVSDDVAAMRGAQDAREKIDARRWAIQAALIAALTLVLGVVEALHHWGR